MGKKKSPKFSTKKKILAEVAWEVCNQVGGIYTVIRSKVPVMVEKWSDKYVLLGPNVNPNVVSDFEPHPEDKSVLAQVAREVANDLGWDVQFGNWLVSGRPQTVLFNPHSVYAQLGDIKYYYWQNHHIEFKNHDPLMDQVLAFGYMVKEYLSRLARKCLDAD